MCMARSESPAQHGLLGRAAFPGSLVVGTLWEGAWGLFLGAPCVFQHSVLFPGCCSTGAYGPWATLLPTLMMENLVAQLTRSNASCGICKEQVQKGLR